MDQRCYNFLVDWSSPFLDSLIAAQGVGYVFGMVSGYFFLINGSKGEREGWKTDGISFWVNFAILRLFCVPFSLFRGELQYNRIEHAIRILLACQYDNPFLSLPSIDVPRIGQSNTWASPQTQTTLQGQKLTARPNLFRAPLLLHLR